jgi:hypothetical protein
VCILLGCGIPTTANYIIMVTVAAPTLVQLGVEPLVAHFFVFYYGVLADITPPVALAAYAAAGMAGQRPVQDRQHGLPAGHGQGAGAVRVRVLAVAAAGGQGLHLVRLQRHLHRLRARHHLLAAALSRSSWSR